MLDKDKMKGRKDEVGKTHGRSDPRAMRSENRGGLYAYFLPAELGHKLPDILYIWESYGPHVLQEMTLKIGEIPCLQLPQEKKMKLSVL